MKLNRITFSVIAIASFIAFTACKEDEADNFQPDNNDNPTDTATYVDHSNGKHSIFYSELATPAGLAQDKQGNIFVAEYGSNRILKINLSSKESTVLANYDDGIESPTGITFYNNELYCTNNNGLLLKINLSNNAVSSIAEIYNTTIGDIEILNDSIAFVSEFNMNVETTLGIDNGDGNKVFKINMNTGNVIHTYNNIGNGTYGLKNYGSNLLVSDLSNCNIAEINLSDNTVKNHYPVIVAQLGDLIIAPNDMIISTEIVMGENDGGNEVVFINLESKETESYFLSFDCKPFGVVMYDGKLYVSELKTGNITIIEDIVFN